MNLRLIFERKGLEAVTWSPTMVRKVHSTMKLPINLTDFIIWKLIPTFVFVETSGLRQRGGDRGLRPPSVALRRGLGIGTTGGRVGNWHGKLRFH